MIAWSWETGQMVIAALAPLVAVPLGVITFYLRSLYENQMNRHAELVRRFELVERMTTELAKTVSGFALDYTTKEEWLRECMYARGRIERLAEIIASERGPNAGVRVSGTGKCASADCNCRPEHSEGSR